MKFLYFHPKSQSSILITFYMYMIGKEPKTKFNNDTVKTNVNNNSNTSFHTSIDHLKHLLLFTSSD